MNKDLTSTGLPLNVIEKIQQVFSKSQSVTSVLLYGSRAKGNYSNGSDIDLSIMDNKIDFSTLLKIENDLDDIMLPYKIDLSLFSNIKNVDLIDHIKRLGIEFYHR